MKKIIILIVLTILMTGCQISIKFNHNEDDSVAKKENTVEKETVYLTLECRKRKSKDTYTLSESIVSEYRDSEVLNVKVQFLYTNKKNSLAISPPQEVQKYKDISVKELEKVELESNKGYEFFMDFEKNPSLKNAIELKEHTYNAPERITNMTSLGYQCTQKSKYAIRVYKDGKLVEEKFLEK